MPLFDNIDIFAPVPPDWKLVTCPNCDRLCYESDLCRQDKMMYQEAAFCTECAWHGLSKDVV